MNTLFSFFDKQLTLQRYPADLQHVSWQAWDAADELLIEHIISQQLLQNGQTLRIYNDDFGTLGTWFADARPQWISDSFVAGKALQQNLVANGYPEDQLEIYDCLTSPSQPPALVVMKIPKTIALLEHQLIQLQREVSGDCQIIAGGKARNIQKSTLALFEKYLGPTTTSLAKKKARLIFCSPESGRQHKSPFPTEWRTEHPAFLMRNHANVFARQQLDIGARLLMQHLPDCNQKRVVDLGCGNGILGLTLLHRFADAQVVFVDESHMAIASARENVASNLPERLNDCQFLVSNCLEQFDQLEDARRPDVVLCNPPFHQQNAITDHIAFQMFKDARYRLNTGGELRIIGNRHLDYPQKLKRLFGGYKVVASDRKFSILSAIKR